MSETEKFPAPTIVLFSAAPGASRPVGELNVNEALVRTVRELSRVCTDHDLQGVELAWAQTEAPAPAWHLTDKVPGLKLRVNPRHFELEGHLDGGRELITTQPICMSRLGETCIPTPSEDTSTHEERPCHA